MSEEESFKSERRQYISMIICWISYTCACIGRYSYSANIGLVEKDYGVSHASAGLVMTFFAVTYGLGQFVHAAFCVKYPRKYIVPLALGVSSFMNILVFFGVPFGAIKYLWLISAVFQSILWPMCLQVISENVGGKLMRKAILLMGTTTSLGTFAVYGISAAFAETNYRLTFLASGLIMFSLALIWFVSYKPGGFVNVKKTERSRKSGNERLVYILTPVILLGLFSVIANFLKDGIQTWVPVILKSVSGKLPDSFSLLLTLILPLFGAFGSVLAVNVNKKIPKAISLVMFFFGFIGLFSFIVFKFNNNIPVLVLSFAILELLLHASSVSMGTIFSLSMREKMSSGRLAGIINGSAYIGTASATYVLGKIADVSGWSAVFATLLGVVLSSLLLGAAYLLVSLKYPKLNP